jgi:hypothetical protein
VEFYDCGGTATAWSGQQSGPGKWSNGCVEATSTGAPAAVLTVQGFGQMDYDAGKNKYTFLLKPVNTYPGTVTVVSDLGGSATKSVRNK